MLGRLVCAIESEGNISLGYRINRKINKIINKTGARIYFCLCKSESKKQCQGPKKMIEIDKTIIDKKDKYFEIPLEDVVDDFLVTFYIRSGDWRGDVIQKVKISKDLLQGHLTYTGSGLLCKIPLSKIL